MISEQKLKLNIKTTIILVLILEILSLSFPIAFAQTTPRASTTSTTVTTPSTTTTSLASNIRTIDFTAQIINNENREITNGEYEVRFAIYRTNRTEKDLYPSTSDARVWEETQKINLTNGILKANLGSVTSLPTNLNFTDGEYYLGVRLGEDSEMVPRKKIGAVPNSLNSFVAEVARDANALEGHTTGIAAGNIPLLGSGGKFATSVLPTITSLGTVGSGTWEADAIANDYIEDALTGKTYNGLELAESSNGFSITGGNRKLTIKDTNITLDQSLATSDAVNFSSLELDNALDIASGGTGLSELGTANQILGVNNSAGELEYKTLTAGANITITSGAGSVTIAATSGTNYTAGGTLLQLTGTTFSLKEGTLADTKICTYSATSGLVCNTDAGAVGASYTAGNDLDLVGTQFDLESTLDTVSTINLAGAGTINGLDAIDGTSESTLEAALDIAGDVTGTGLNSVTIASGFTRDTEWDTQGEVETIWGATLTNDSEWNTQAEVETIWGSTLATDAELSGHNHSGTYEPIVSIGTANYIWGMNAAGNAKEWKQLVQGSNVTITHGVNSITIASTDTNTTYTASNDLDLTGTEFSLESVLDTVTTINNLTTLNTATINRTSANLTLQTTTSGDILLSPAGNVGIGTASPGEKLEVTGNIKLNGNLVNDGNNRAIGAASNRFTYGYFENLDVTNMSVGGVDISGSTSNTFTVNSDNVSADGEDGSIGFERGSVSPNAIISWDSGNDEFDFNFPLNVTGTITATGGNSTNWNSAYTYRLTGASGTAPLTLTLNANNLTGSIADATDLTKGVASFSNGDFSVAAGAVSIVSGLTRDAEWDSQSEVETIWGASITNDSEWNTQGEVETIWGSTLATDAELAGHNHSGTYEPVISTGTANYIWGMNAAGNAKEWKQLVAGSNVTITHGVNLVTIAATDTNTTYTAGNDLDLVGTQFDIESQLDYVSTISRDSADLTLQTTTSGDIVLYPAGNVGIGTTDPKSKLQVDERITVVEGVRYWSLGAGRADGSGNGYPDSATVADGTFAIRDVWMQRDRLRIDPNGNVGIGTTSPQHKLHVVSGASGGFLFDGSPQGFSRLYLPNSVETTATDNYIGSLYSGLELSTDGSVKMSILNNGNVGIGTTTPSAKLTINDSSAAAFRVGINNNASNAVAQIRGGITSVASNASSTTSVGAVAWDHYNDGTNPTWSGTFLQHAGTSYAGNMYGLAAANQGTLIFQNVSAGVIGTNGANIYVSPGGAAVSTTFLTSGNVGIGTVSPNAGLHVVDRQITSTGIYGIAMTTSASWAGFALDSGTSTKTLGVHFGDGNDFRLGRYGNGLASWEANPYRLDLDAAADTFVITEAGYIGMGTGSPGNRLQVNQDWFDNNTNDWGGGIKLYGTNPTLSFWETDNGTHRWMWHLSNDTMYLYRRPSGGSWENKVFFDNGGNIYTGGGTQYIYNSGTWGINISGNADTLDGSHSSAFMAAATDNWVNVSGDTMTGRLAQATAGFNAGSKDDISTRTDSGFYQTATATIAEGWPTNSNNWYQLLSSTHTNDANYYSMQFAGSYVDSNEIYYRATNGSGATGWSKIWHAGNDGSGSGLDADTLDGFNSSAFGDATAANQTTILSRIGTAADAASMNTTLFAGQQAIYDKVRNGVAKRVFVTSTDYDGNLGGLAGADAKCQARADAASLGGTWKAILSYSDVDGENAITRIGYNWTKLVDVLGRPIVDHFVRSDYFAISPFTVRLTSGSHYLFYAIRYTELGTDKGDAYPWTNTHTDGTAIYDGSGNLNNNCWGFTSNSVSWHCYTGNTIQTGGQWVYSSYYTCNTTHPLYCIEQ